MSAVPDLIGEYRSRLQSVTEREDLILSLLDEGVPRGEIAQRVGVGYSVIGRVVTRRRPDELARKREERRAGQLIAALPFDERHEYELEGVTRIMIGGLSVADEDYDPTPPPEGCPSCWRGPGAIDAGPCQRCPDPEAKARCRLERRGRLASRT